MIELSIERVDQILHQETPKKRRIGDNSTRHIYPVYVLV